jgi:hypothetical protein
MCGRINGDEEVEENVPFKPQEMEKPVRRDRLEG